MTIAEAIRHATEKLTERGVATPRLDAEVLLGHVLGRDRAWLIVHSEDPLGEDKRALFEQTIGRRAKREPLQYITGKQEFWGLEFIVSPDVLIPRPETELIVETALKKARGAAGPLTIVDLCTGSGCIAVSLAKEMPTVRIFATDASGKALAVARENARRHGVSDRIRFLEGDLLGPLEELDILGQVDIIAANPPYIQALDLLVLQPEVRDYEPEIALTAGPEGTELQRRIVGQAPRFLKKEGVLIMEMAIGQADTLSRMVEKNGEYTPPEILKDLAGIDRVIVARKT